MVKRILTFRVDLANRDWEAEEKLRHQLAKTLGLEIKGSWISLDLNSRQLPEIISKLQFELSVSALHIADGHITETYLPDEKCEWFTFSGRARFTRADAMLPGCHVAPMYGLTPSVSERFREVVTSSKLTGIEFLWTGDDESRFRAMQWYKAWATTPLGRGIDHPCFDAQTLKGNDSFQWTEPEFRTGVWNFANDQFHLHSDWGSSSANSRISMFPERSLRVYSHRRVLRSFLPTTDFAYLWDLKHSRMLCFNQRAKEVLVENLLLREGEFTGIEVLDAPIPPSVQLDGIAPLPPPFKTAEETQQLRQQQAGDWEGYLRYPKPERSNDLGRSLRMVHDVLEDNEGDEQELEVTNDRQIRKLAKELPLPLPEAWKRLLKIANGAYLPGDAYLFSVKELPELHVREQGIIQPGDEGYGMPLLHIATSGGGDCFSLLIESSQPIDVPVLRFDHETNRISRRWETIAAFLEEMVEEED